MTEELLAEHWVYSHVSGHPVQRIKKGQTSVETDQRLAIAEAIDMELWQRLQRDVMPQNLTPIGTAPVASRVQIGQTLFAESHRQADHRSLATVWPNAKRELTCRQLPIKGKQRVLQAPNPQRPHRIIPINGNGSLCCGVIGKVESFI